MSVGTLSMTCLMLLTGQTELPDFINTRAFKIPVEVEPARRAELLELKLYRSADLGKSWREVKSIKPDQDGFLYHGEEDGYFWFQIAAVNKQGQQDPENLYKGKNSRKIVIDTVKPDIRITSAQRQNGELVVTWEIQESYPDRNSLKLEYHSDDQPPHLWQPIPATPGPTGTARARLTSDSPLTVRLSLKDLAENSAVAHKPVAGANGVMPISFSSPVTTDTAQPTTPAFPPPAPIVPPPAPPVPLPAAPAYNVQPPPATPVKQEVQTPTVAGPVAPTPVASSLNPVPPPLPTDRMNTPPHQWTQGMPPTGLAPGCTGNGQVVARSDGALPPNPAAITQLGSSPKMPPRQIVNDREILLEYELSKVGPSGIGTVELWLSKDGGLTWGDDPYEDTDPKASTSGGKYQRTLLLPGDGVYGLYMVVRNSVGLGKPKPKAGDVPEMIVEVDTTQPRAQLWGPQPVPDQRDQVSLKWTAEDVNLAPNPITLEWAEKQEGPWHIIGSPNMPNTGNYQWKLPEQIPANVFLRLRVKDTAGNEGVAVTPQAQLVDLSVPEGRLLIARPASRH